MNIRTRIVSVGIVAAITSIAATAADDFRRPPGKLDLDTTKSPPKQEPLNKPQIEKADPKPTVTPAHTPAIDSKGKKVEGGGVNIRF
jgi:hypothetical protein